MKTKKELLIEIEKRELKRIDSLLFHELSREVSEWFSDEIMPHESREDITTDYMNDFMRYRYDESIEELNKFLERYVYQKVV